MPHQLKDLEMHAILESETSLSIIINLTNQVSGIEHSTIGLADRLANHSSSLHQHLC